MTDSGTTTHTEAEGAQQPDAGPKLGKHPLDLVAGRITEVSTLPHIALRVMEVASDPDAGAADLRKIVEGDPSLSARLLKCVNSALYGLRFRINNLQRAISYLGFKQVRNLAITASVSDTFKGDVAFGPYTRAGLWRHLVAVGVCARFIAARKKMGCFEEAFLAGLLHDIGIVLEDQYCQPAFGEMMENLPPNKPLCSLEMTAFGFDHTRLGQRLAEQWRFPPEVIDTIRYHHMPASYKGEHTDILACVDLANLVCTLKRMPSVGVNLLKSTHWSVQMLRLTKDDVKVLATDLDDELSIHESLFNL